MTAIAGVLCQHGLVIGADSSATLGVGNFRTIEQPIEKISIVKERVVVACTGSVGLAQRFQYVVETAYEANKFSGHHIEVGRHLSTMAINDFVSTQWVDRGRFGALVGFPIGEGGVHLCEFGQADFQPEFKDANMWFCSMGSGITITDPFLALMREVFWKKGPPTIQDGIFGVTWALQHAVNVNTGGINGPVRVAVLERNKEEKGKFRARSLDESDLQEHQDNIAAAKKALQSFKEGQQPDNSNTPETPKP